MTNSRRNQIEWPGGEGVLRVLSNGKRRYSAGFKAWVVQQCLHPGASLAGVSLANGLNATMLRKWVVEHKESAPEPTGAAAVQLLPVEIQTPVAAQSSAAVTPAVAAKAGLIELEIHGARLRLHGGVDAERLVTVLDALAARR